MTRDSGLEPVLGPWMRRSAPVAPNHLLDRVMTEVETMSQRPAAGISRFAAMPAHALVTAAALVAMVAVAAGILIGNNVRIGPAPAATASPTPVETRFTDRTGDGPSRYDIVAVTTSVVEGDVLRLAVELATPWPDDAMLNAWFVPDEAGHPSGGFGTLRSCDPYGAGYGLHFESEWQMYTGGPSAPRALFTSHTHNAAGAGHTTHRQYLHVVVEGNVMTIDIPLALLGDPEKLGIALNGFIGEGSDTWPDGKDGDCQAVPLSAP